MKFNVGYVENTGPFNSLTSGSQQVLGDNATSMAGQQLIRRVMERGEQVLVASAFQDGLDVCSAPG